jgi:Domain of unknown function (DUF1814).
MTGNPGRAGLRNVSASVYAKLRNHARAKGLDTQTVLARYVQERLLHRLSVSEEAENFCLKGGLLIAAYNNGDLLRPTEDIDFNGFDEDGSVARIKDAMRCVLATDVEDDGVIFDISSMRVVKSRDDGVIPGGKVLVHAVVHTARVDLKIDVGFGNVITPGVSPVEFPSLLDGTAPRPLIKAYPLETTIAEKLHAMAQFGYENTRLKDHFDILILSRIRRFDGAVLAQAIERTFERQGRPIPETLEGLSETYAEEHSFAWSQFIRRVAPGFDMNFSAVIREIRALVDPVMAAARGDAEPPGVWEPGHGWPDLICVPSP